MNLEVQKMSKMTFELFVMCTRLPNPGFTIELDYFTNYNNTITATLNYDEVDYDFAGTILCRDENSQFRCIDLEVSIPTRKEAQQWIIDKIKEYTQTETKIVEQGDSKKGVILFEKITAKKPHPYFLKVLEGEFKDGAKRAIVEIANHFHDIDGSYVKEFQSLNGFDARVWEMYLFAFFNEQEFMLDRNYNRPDFMLSKWGVEIFVEATIVARDVSKTPIIEGPFIEKTLEEIRRENENDMPLRWSNALSSKLRKEYWKLEHVKDKPLIIAIADFHEEKSMTWSHDSLAKLLYGYKYIPSRDSNGNLVITPVEIEPYTKANGTKINSGFFFEPDAEHISGVLFSATATISKFNRIGVQAGFGNPKQRIFREGNCWNPDPNSSEAKAFRYEVKEGYNENWSEGMNLYHNPNALYPIDMDMFPDIAHHRLRDDKLILADMPRFYPFSSHDLIIISGESNLS